jgi:hypothetical protein
MASIIEGKSGLNRSLDRISSGICESAVRLHRQDHQQLARWASAFQLQEQLAGLREEIRARRAWLKVSMPPVIWPAIELSTSLERSLRKAA